MTVVRHYLAWLLATMMVTTGFMATGEGEKEAKAAAGVEREEAGE